MRGSPNHFASKTCWSWWPACRKLRSPLAKHWRRQPVIENPAQPLVARPSQEIVPPPPPPPPAASAAPDGAPSTEPIPALTRVHTIGCSQRRVHPAAQSACAMTGSTTLDEHVSLTVIQVAP